MPAARPGACPVHVTKREGDVLNLLAGGLTNEDIAATMGISCGTVKHHLNSAQAKLLPSSSDKLNSRVLLARYWNYPIFRRGAGWDEG